MLCRPGRFMNGFYSVCIVKYRLTLCKGSASNENTPSLCNVVKYILYATYAGMRILKWNHVRPTLDRSSTFSIILAAHVCIIFVSFFSPNTRYSYLVQNIHTRLICLKYIKHIRKENVKTEKFFFLRILLGFSRQTVAKVEIHILHTCFIGLGRCARSLNILPSTIMVCVRFSYV